ncbi:sodium:solute symporter family protein [Elusimicrobiota bacterium]
MHFIDWLIVAVYFIAAAFIGVYFSKRAGKSLKDFFLSGQNMPWWLAGTSMVATTFAADTPLAVTELVAKNGIAGNWIWWNFVFGGMLTVFFFARLWRRAGVMTDVEFIELRYCGKPAAFLRGFRSIYLGIFLNCVIIGWVNLAFLSILEGMFGISGEHAFILLAFGLVVAASYSALGGLWGVMVTDAFQFILAMGGCFVLAIIVLSLPEVGGVAGLKEKLPPGALSFIPTLGETGNAASAVKTFSIGIATFIAFIGVQWWASWYPGAEPGGGGYIAQRMMSAKDERHSVFATLWFTVAHYCVRPWPWIIVGLASLVLYPELGASEKKLGFVYAMRDHLPIGVKGMLVASFFAAYMSTISTQLNWGTSYFVNDFYKRFIKPKADENHFVRVSRAATIGIMIFSLIMTSLMDTISGAWVFIIEASAGLGLVLILRWFWWRINAWSEITAMIIPACLYAYLKLFTSMEFPNTLFLIVIISTISWILATFITKPTDEITLKRFYKRVHPGGWGWKPLMKSMPEVKSDKGYARLVITWILGVILVYSFLFGIGNMIFNSFVSGGIFMAIGSASGIAICKFGDWSASSHD